ncbi:MAG: hypothetical protein PHR35_10505, partial [Kiritimatiellae bacterium]|nr:hypothetical protein [Kiritimatiellia bacterium]
MTHRSWLTLTVLLMLAVLSRAEETGLIERGGCYQDGRYHHLRLSAGGIVEIEGMVEETTRKFYSVTGNTRSQADAETYDESDFNMQGPYPALGLSYEVIWNYVTFNADATFFWPSTRATARRDYY